MPYAPHEGTSLGKHVLVRRLGEGSLGTVWEARKLDTDEHVALKVIEPDPSALESTFVRIQRAAKSARRVDHAGMAAVRSIELLETEGVVLLESELLVGCDLATWMKKSGIGIEDTLRLVRHALRPIAAAHGRRDENGQPLGLAHRDLTPGNIFVLDAPTWEGTTRSLLPVKVLDFGLARPEGEPVLVSPKMRGTPAYTSPEVFVGEAHFGATVDVWSMGAILFEILAGQRPFHGGPVEVAAKIVATEAPSLGVAAPWVDAAWVTIVDRCLSKDPSERYQDAGELARAMDDVLGLEASERTEWVQVTLVDEADGAEPSESAPSSVSTSRPVPSQLATESTKASNPAKTAATPAPSPAAPPSPTSEPGSSLPWLALFVLVAGLGIYFFTRKSDDARRPVADAAEARVDGGRASTGDAGAGATVATSAADDAFVRITGAVKRRERYFSNYWGDYQVRDVTVGLGLAMDDAPASLYGFRPRREIFAPEATFDIHANEVTWAELEAFLATHPELRVTRPAGVPDDAAARARRPATNVPWEVADAFCRAIGGALPTEEQWEYAARGDARRIHPWGNAPIDPAHTRVYAGVSASEVDVGTSSQDVTPEGVHDLVGNAREWTDGFFRDPNRESNDRRASAEDTLRAVRGLPVASALPTTLPEVSTAYREPVCGVAACAPSAAAVLAHVGFRCVRPVAAPPGAAATDAGTPSTP